MDSAPLSTGEAAELLRVTPQTVINWCKRGRLAYTVTGGGHRRIERADVAALAPTLPGYVPPPSSTAGTDAG